MVEYWTEHGGRVEDLGPFLLSAGRTCPSIDVFCRLYTFKRMAGADVEPGDIYDTAHLALAVPYTDAVVTEAHWGNVVQQLKLDKKYETKIFTIKSLPRFLEWLGP